MRVKSIILQEANRQKFITSISLSVFIAATFFLFLPFTVYKGNINEFAVTLTSMLSYFLFPALIFIFSSYLIGMGFLFPKELHQRYISIHLNCLNVDKLSIGLAILHKGSPRETN